MADDATDEEENVVGCRDGRGGERWDEKGELSLAMDVPVSFEIIERTLAP